MPSFDIVSEADHHEIKNALDQAERELKQRYDFKGTDSEIVVKKEEEYEMLANSEDRVKAVLEVFKEKLVKRKVSLKFIDVKDLAPKGGGMFCINVKLKKGIDKEQAKIIVNAIKADKTLKVVPTIQGEVIRVSGKKRDDLQAAIAILRNATFDIELEFNNFRE